MSNDLVECFGVMAKGNMLMKALAELCGFTHKRFRNTLLRLNYDLTAWKELTEAQKVEIAFHLPQIKAVAKVKDQVFAAYSRLASKLAKKFFARSNSAAMDYWDFEQDAFIALCTAIYTYTDMEVAFSTFSYYVIRNHLVLTYNTMVNPFGALTNEANHLLQAYEEVEKSFNRRVSEEDVFNAMELTPKERSVLRKAQVSCVNASQIATEDESGSIEDYTMLRKGIDHEPEMTASYDLWEAVEKAHLTPLEEKIVRASVIQKHGWKSEMARTTFNNKGVAISKTTIDNILKRALRKIYRVYVGQKVA